MSEKELEQKVEVTDKELESVSGGFNFGKAALTKAEIPENNAVIDGAVPAKLDDK